MAKKVFEVNLVVPKLLKANFYLPQNLGWLCHKGMQMLKPQTDLTIYSYFYLYIFLKLNMHVNFMIILGLYANVSRLLYLTFM